LQPAALRKEARTPLTSHGRYGPHAALLILGLAAGPVGAQVEAPTSPTWRPHQVTVSALGGGAAYSSFLTVELATGDERLTARTAMAVAGALGYWPRRGWGVRLHGGWAPTRFERERRGGNEPGTPPDARGANLSVWMADLDLLIRLPIGLGRVEPYGVVGGGVVRYVADESAALPSEARGDFAAGTSTRGALVLGAGALIPMQRRDLLLTFEVTDHVVRSPVRGPTGQAASVTSNVRLLVGLTLPLFWAGF